ncbi:hypothetical protein MJ579_23500 [Klebsiella pneumoniae]|nr:hypothetical protein MJ579_23500 [Klebsiella pneumoniae]
MLMGAILAPPQPRIYYYFKTMFHFFMMMITKKEKQRGASPARAVPEKVLEKMKIQPIVCRGAEAKPAAR